MYRLEGYGEKSSPIPGKPTLIKTVRAAAYVFTAAVERG
jgi:hypothetical protein